MTAERRAPHESETNALTPQLEHSSPSSRTMRNPSKEITPRRISAQLRRNDALVLRQQGLTFAQIANELGYSSAGEARKQIMKAFEAVPVAEAEELRQIQLQRLESLLFSVWPAAQRGNMRAVNTAERLVGRISFLMGLEGPSPNKRRESPRRFSGGTSLND